MRKYIVTKKACDKHKIVLKVLFLITYILFFPFVILAYIYDFLEIVLNFAEQLRNKIVYGIFKILFKKDCKVERRINNMCKYCENDGYYNRNKSLISKTLKNKVDIDLAINVKDKKIVASVENLTMNPEDNNWILPTKKINYCPMCGRKLKEGD